MFGLTTQQSIYIWTILLNMATNIDSCFWLIIPFKGAYGDIHNLVQEWEMIGPDDPQFLSDLICVTEDEEL